MFFPFLTSEEVSHFPNEHFYFIFEKLYKVSFLTQFIASQTFVKSVTLILIYCLTFVKKQSIYLFSSSLGRKKNTMSEFSGL